MKEQAVALAREHNGQLLNTMGAQHARRLGRSHEGLDVEGRALDSLEA